MQQLRSNACFLKNIDPVDDFLVEAKALSGTSSELADYQYRLIWISLFKFKGL